MKKIAKTYSRKGFTLVETLLAVFILIVVSTMLINGFITTMAYSYQTSVYSKSGANNYKACMNTLSKWNHYENLGDDGREAAGQNYINQVNKHTLSFDTGDRAASFESLDVAVIKSDNLSLTVPNEVRYGTRDYTPTSDSYADNHKVFVYYPEYCSDTSGGNTGKIVVMYDKNADEYYWVIKTGTSDNLAGATKVVPDAIHSGS